MTQVKTIYASETKPKTVHKKGFFHGLTECNGWKYLDLEVEEMPSNDIFSSIFLKYQKIVPADFLSFYKTALRGYGFTIDENKSDEYQRDGKTLDVEIEGGKAIFTFDADLHTNFEQFFEDI